MGSDSRENYMERLITKSRELGIEDISENELISNFMINYDFYQSILDRSLSDGIISVREKANLYKFRASMVIGDLKLMREKDEITPEDIEILKEILHIIDLMRQDEEEFPSMA